MSKHEIIKVDVIQAIKDFNDEYDLSEIILLGKEKGIRRIILE